MRAKKPASLPARVPPSEPSPSAPAPAPPARRHRDWDALGVAIASSIGLIALAVSAYTAYVQRQQMRAQVWPHVQLVNFGLEQKLGVRNSGMGPARVEAVWVVVDGKTARDWVDALGRVAPGKNFNSSHSTLNNTVIPPGETRDVLVLEDREVFRTLLTLRDQNRFSVWMCYCSVLDECWSESFGHRPSHLPPDHTPVDGCALDPRDRFEN